MISELIRRYPDLHIIKSEIDKATKEIISCYENGGKLLLCGNGGSAADCEHIVGELMKGFLKKRPVSDKKKKEMKANAPFIEDEILSKLQSGLPAVSLPSMIALNSAFCNDVEPELAFAQSVMAMATEKDILIAISTSGNSKNVCAAVKVARALNCKVIGLTGKTGGSLKNLADVCICTPADETFKIQEYHLPIYHCICAMIEDYFFKE